MQYINTTHTSLVAHGCHFIFEFQCKVRCVSHVSFGFVKYFEIIKWAKQRR